MQKKKPPQEIANDFAADLIACEAILDDEQKRPQLIVDLFRKYSEFIGVPFTTEVLEEVSKKCRE